MKDQELSLAICKPHTPGSACHWILTLAPMNAQHETWYHVTGGPTQYSDYKLVIQTKRVDSPGVQERYHIASILHRDVRKLKASLQSHTPRFCQRWAVDVLGDLEWKALVPPGTWENWFRMMEVDPYSDDGAPRAAVYADARGLRDSPRGSNCDAHPGLRNGLSCGNLLRNGMGVGSATSCTPTLGQRFPGMGLVSDCVQWLSEGRFSSCLYTEWSSNLCGT